MLVSILSSTMVDTFRAYEYHFPGDTQGGPPDALESRLKSFVAKVIDEIKPAQTTRVPPPGASSVVTNNNAPEGHPEPRIDAVYIPTSTCVQPKKVLALKSIVRT